MLSLLEFGAKIGTSELDNAVAADIKFSSEKGPIIASTL